MHNLVNQRLDKPEFDCSTLSDHFDCDCGVQPDQFGLDAQDAQDAQDTDVE